MASALSVEISGPIATITFNRPQSLNAITVDGILLYWHHLTVTHPYPACLQRLYRICECIEKH